MTDPETGRLLETICDFVRRYVVLGPDQLVAVALWTVHTHVVEAVESTPYLACTSAEKRSGKTRLLEVLELLVREPLPTANISDAALFRAIADLQPTLLLDEVDAIFGAKARDREDLRGLLNAGYRRGAVVRRMGGPKMTTLEAFPVFCPKVFAAIGELPDTISDRAIRVRLDRRTRDEAIERFRRRDVQESAEPLHQWLVSWGQDHVEHVAAARPALPDELDDRAQDGWEVLLAIADRAGGAWPERARHAAIVLSGPEAREDDSNTARLLADIHRIFEKNGTQRFRTAELIEELCEIEESPWGDWYGKPITPQSLSKLLRPHRIKTMPVWADGTTVRGYKREQFENAWHRVLGVRSDRSVSSGSASEAEPNRPNSPNAQPTMGRAVPVLGDEMFPVLLADTARDQHITEAEAERRYALHRKVARQE